MTYLPVGFLALLVTFSAVADERPSFSPRRITQEQIPRIDADLSDPIWLDAESIGMMRQVEPREDGEPTEVTIAKVVYDGQYLYVAVEAFDSSPGQIAASVMRRDGNLRDDDHIMLLLDPFGSQRDGYAFAINPIGSRWDALIENNARTAETWDAIWNGSARIVADGWVAELAIPFRSISWAGTGESWGFQIIRTIQRTKEQIRWSSVSQSIPAENVSQIGSIHGLQDIRTGVGFDVEGFVTAGWRDDGGAAEHSEIEPGANLFYRMTPSLTGTATINPDFSDTPLDERRVNTGRFALFFPETRAFFLQDAAAFEFGGRSLSGDPNGLPFFSRQIGIAGGEVVDLDFGVKLSGRTGPAGIGIMSARAGEGLSVARISFDAFSESKGGIILTNGDPLGRDDNTVAGADFQYRNSRLFGNRTLQADAFFVHSESSLRPDDDAFGFELAYPNDRHSWNTSVKEIGRDYAPALGFVNRPGIRSWAANYRFRSRPDGGPLRWWQLESWNELVSGLGGGVESRVNGATAWMRTNGGDETFIESWQTFEDISVPFDLPRGVRVAAGEYTWNRANTAFRSSRSRRFAVSAGASCCDFYDGTSLVLSSAVFLRPNRYLGLDLSHRMEDIELPSGDVTIRISSLTGSVSFMPSMGLALQTQHDNISERLVVNARWHWEIIPGSEVLIAVGRNAVYVDRRAEEPATEASVRFAHTLRY